MELDKFRDVDLVIDHVNKTFIQKQFVSQNDNDGRSLTVQVTNNGAIGEVTGLTLNLRWSNQSSGLTDLSAFQLIDKKNSVFQIKYPKTMLNPGKVVASIQIMQNGQVAHSKQFEITVQQLAGEVKGVIEKAEYSALVEVLADSNKFRTDIDSLEIVKANKTDVANVEDMILKMPSATPKETFNDFGALKAKYPSGNASAMVVLESDGKTGFVYLWDGSEWKKGALYQSQGIADDSVTIPKLDPDTRLKLAPFRTQDLRVQKGYLTYDSKIVSNITYLEKYRTIIAECSPEQVWNCDVSVNSDTTSACIFWKKDGTFLRDLERGAGSILQQYEFTIPPNAKFVSVTSLAEFAPVLRLQTTTDTKVLIDNLSDVQNRLMLYKKKELEIKVGYLTYDSKNVSSITYYNGYRTITSECEPGQVWNCDVSVNSDTTSACIFWKEDGTFLRDLERGAGTTLTEYSFTIPKNAHYVSVTSLSTGIDPVLRLAENGKINDLERRVAELEKPDVPSLRNKKIINFGDSIYGNARPPQDISTLLGKILGAEVLNLGFGGCMMAKREDQTKWDAWSMQALSESISKNDFSVQEAAITQSGLPSYFKETFDLLKIIDWSDIDICTIAYGTNDYTFTTNGGSIPLDDNNDPWNVKTFKGALRYSIENLFEKNANLQIVLCCPIYRFWNDSEGHFIIDSDKNPINGLKLTDFVNAVKEVAFEYKLPYFDAYNDLGFNKQTRKHFFSETDTTHPNQKGRDVIASRLACFIKGNCW